jgi:hypothetical protein
MPPEDWYVKAMMRVDDQRLNGKYSSEPPATCQEPPYQRARERVTPSSTAFTGEVSNEVPCTTTIRSPDAEVFAQLHVGRSLVVNGQESARESPEAPDDELPADASMKRGTMTATPVILGGAYENNENEVMFDEAMMLDEPAPAGRMTI